MFNPCLRRNLLRSAATEPGSARARFEKFNWFVSSENYLVLGARDPAQADQLFLRVMTSRDVYVHADVAARGSAEPTR